MANKLKDIVTFRSDLLFEGAVNIDWFITDDVRCNKAAESFVFHGAEYHGISQDDIGVGHSHRLQDTASFALSVAKRCFGLDSQPFTMAIAGYGTGKSHLALTLAELFSDPGSSVSRTILNNIQNADARIGKEIGKLIEKQGSPCLVIALNGIRNFDLAAEMIRQVKWQLRNRQMDTRILDDVRPRFMQAAKMIEVSNEKVISELLKLCDVNKIEEIFKALDNQDEFIYAKVQEFYESKGSRIRALGVESLQDVIDTICKQYCGDSKPFKSLVVLFDEFGRYTEFATISKQIAGSGVLQELFEGIQANSDKSCFIGFIQFELNAYVQRVADVYKNEIQRYVGRYDIADKVYLSINLETLIANLLKKNSPKTLDKWFDTDGASDISCQIAGNLHDWFPASRNHRLWNDPEQFHGVIRKGCWPLSPYSTWFFFQLAAAGKHLQQRSALALLADAFNKYSNVTLPADGDWSVYPVALWSDQLQEELINSEEVGQQGAITLAYKSVYNQHSAQLSADQINLLRSIVLASKMGLRVNSRDEAIDALTALTGGKAPSVEKGLDQLEEEYNVIDWDDGFKEFGIRSDAVSRKTFRAFLKKQADKLFDESGVAELFIGKASQWAPSLLCNLECDFAEQHEITTKEWNYQCTTSNVNSLDMHLRSAIQQWNEEIDVDAARGTIIYCYVERSRDPRKVESEIKKQVSLLSKQANIVDIPILIMLLHDQSGEVGDCMAELAIVEDRLTEEERIRFGNLIPSHKEKILKTLESKVEDLMKERRYISFTPNVQFSSQRLSKMGTELFEHVYSKIVPFPFDGFRTARGNAANTCQHLTLDILSGKLDYDSVISEPVQTKNRAISVLKDCWQIFTHDGAVAKRPAHSTIREIIDRWEKILKTDNGSIDFGRELQEICKPPYGANLASAGLLLAVFVGARVEKLVIFKNGTQYAISQWLQDGVFKGKFLDYKGLRDIRISYVGEIASEWTELFEQWDQAESYLERNQLFEKAVDLNSRIPYPPSEQYRYQLLEDHGIEAGKMLSKMQREQNEALERLEKGYAMDDVAQIGWGAKDLKRLNENMSNHGSSWTNQQIEEFQPQVAEARQKIIQLFPQWIKRQTLMSTQPEMVGNYRHKMINLIGGNLQKLELDDLYEKLEAHVNSTVRNVEITAEANQLALTITSWIQQNHAALTRMHRKEIHSLINTGREYKNKLDEMSEKTKLVDLSKPSTLLTQFQEKLDNSIAKIRDLGFQITESKISKDSDIDELILKVNELCNINEGYEDDIQRFYTYRNALRDFERANQQLQNDGLTWKELRKISSKLKEELDNKYGNDGIPWSSDESINSLMEQITLNRNIKSKNWTANLVADTAGLDQLPLADANRLYDQANHPPAYITDEDLKSVDQLKVNIESRLNSLAVEWLVSKFLELPASAKKEFLYKVKQKINE